MRLVLLGERRSFVEVASWGNNSFAPVEMIDYTQVYDKNTVFVVNCLELNKSDIWYAVETQLALGCKVIIDSFWEAHCNKGANLKSRYSDQVLLMYCGTKDIYNNNATLVPNFFWIREALHNIAVGLDKYSPNRVNDRLFLMPLRQKKIPRDIIFKRLSAFKDSAIMSYCSQGIELPLDKTETNMLVTDCHYDRHFNSDWYDRTYFSMVVESEVSLSEEEFNKYIDESAWPGRAGVMMSGQSIFVTEKTFKPISFLHPFQILGPQGILAHLRSIGFETFPHIFDESYDEKLSAFERIRVLVDNITNFDIGSYLNPLTEEIVQHNKAHFYNRTLLESMIAEEIINPIEKFING